jgi:N-acetylglucosamine kinase-like BadF-type ATPase
VTSAATPARDAGPERVVGVDIGATKTHVALGRGDVVIAEGTFPTASWRTVSSVENASELVELVRRLAGEPGPQLRLGVGAHGCDSTQQCLDFEEALKRHFPGPLRVLNDAELMPLAMGLPGAIGVVSGTGSIGVARDSAQRLVVAGGWGWILGDEGGASGIVREAVRAVLGAIDRGEPYDELARRLMASFGATDGPELAVSFTTSSSAAYWGSRADQVFAAADEGSLTALRVIEDAAEELACLVDRLVERGVVTEDVVAGGGVIQAQARLRDGFVECMGKSRPAIKATVLDRAPVIGAVALATSLPRSTSLPR